MPSNNKGSPDEKESGGGTSSQSIQDEIKSLRSELKKVRKEQQSFRDDIKASLLDVIDLINLVNVEESKAQCDEIIKALPRDESPVREASKENERKEMSQVVLSSDKVEVMNDVGSDEGSDEVEGLSCLLEDEDSVEEDDVEAPPAVRTSNHQLGKSKHQLKKKKESKKKKKKVKKSKKNRASNNSSNKAVNNSSTNCYYWGMNGGVSLKVVKRVVMGLVSIGCLLSMTFGHGNMEEQHSKSSPRRKQQRQHKTRQGLITNAQNGEDGEGPSAARILQTTELLTDSPTTPRPIYEVCDDTLGWVDYSGDNCQWYETFDEPGCPLNGNVGGDMGPAKDNCCHCQHTVSPSTSSHPTSLSGTTSHLTAELPTCSKTIISRQTYLPTTTTGIPTLSPSTSPRPTSSSHPTSLPSTSSHPCSSSFPTDLPSSSSHPTSSSKPSNSPTTTLEQKCQADKTTCGCDAGVKTDYGGTINVTADGVACIRWDEDYVADSPNAGLEDNNFCRNPDYDPNGPWCNTSPPGDDGSIYEDYCNIPTCDPCKCMPTCGQPINETCACHNVLQVKSVVKKMILAASATI